jgi:hypothetical protein
VEKVPLLSLILWLPVVGMVFVLLTPKEQVRLIRFWAHLFTGAVFEFRALVRFRSRTSRDDAV